MYLICVGIYCSVHNSKDTMLLNHMYPELNHTLCHTLCSQLSCIRDFMTVSSPSQCAALQFFAGIAVLQIADYVFDLLQVTLFV